MSKSFQFGTYTQVGRSKQVNDNFSGYFNTPNGDLFVVSNGFGGNVSGATASRMVTESIKVFFQHQVYYNLKEALLQSLLFANSQIQNHSLQNPELEGMSASCAAVLIKGDDVFYTHVGDSRVYLMRNKAIRKLTKDHTFVQQLINQGVIDEEETKFHPRKGEVNKAIGLLKESEKLNESDVFRFEKSDVILLSTPGLHGTLHDYDIEIILRIEESSQNKAEELIKSVLSNDGLENATALVIDFVDAKDLLIPVNIPVDATAGENTENIISVNPETVKPLENFKDGTTENIIPEVPKIEMTNNLQGKKSKGPDWALIILCVLFVIVLGLFFSGWDYMTNDPSSNELLNQPTEIKQEKTDDPIETGPQNQPNSNKVDKKDQKSVLKDGGENKIDEKPIQNTKDTIIRYIVKDGDNISKISEKFNVKKSSLKRLNDLKDDEIKLGQDLKIKVRAVHTVGPGDILSKLASDYNVKKDLIKKANDMAGNKTKRGENLIIPKSEKQ